MAASACGRILRDAAQDARFLRMTRRRHFFVVAGLDPAIHLFDESYEEGMDARVKPAHDATARRRFPFETRF
jgi:hypothetical protein